MGRHPMHGSRDSTGDVATTPPRRIPASGSLFTDSRYKMLTIAPRETQHLVVHRFARERDEKGMR
jgi:hypothetical protein